MRVPPVFHLTAPKNVRSILARGLVPDEDGRIFAFTHMKVANVIAREQCFLNRYTVLRISGRFLPYAWDILPDSVAELSAPYQLIVITDEGIEPKFLSPVGTFNTLHHKATPWDYEIGRKLGQSRKFIDGRASVFQWSHRQTRLGKLSEQEIRDEVNNRLATLCSSCGIGFEASDRARQ